MLKFFSFFKLLYKQTLSQSQMLMYKLGPKQLFWFVDEGGKWGKVNDVIVEQAKFRKFEAF